MESGPPNLVLPNLTASQVIDSLSEWDGMEEAIAPFQDLVVSESGKCIVVIIIPTVQLYLECCKVGQQYKW